MTAPRHRHGHRDDGSSEVTDLALYRPAEAIAGGTAEVSEDVIEDGPGVLVPVDTPGDDTPATMRAVLAAKSAERRPILPIWVRDRDERRYAVRWLAGHVAHTTGYHATRAPKYAARAAGRTPLGAWRLLADIARWVGDAEGAPLRAHTILADDPATYIRLSRQRLERARWRAIVLAFGVAVAAVGGVLLATAAPPWAGALAAAAAMASLVWRASVGRAPLLDRAVVPHRVEKLTSGHVLRALGALGIPGINQALGKNGTGITFPSPIVKDGPGWRAEVDLPHGVTPGHVMDKRRELASGLRRPLGCVWPEPDPGVHEGRLVLWVGYEDMNKARQAPWPLAKGGQADVFKPLPFGTDQRGRPVDIPLMFDSLLVGAKSRMGKSFAVRGLALTLALDPTVQLRIYELRGSGDFGPLEKVAHEYGSGVRPETIAALVDTLKQLRLEEFPRRADTIARLPRDLCPEGKITPDLARQKSLGLHPIVLIIDECQQLFLDPKYGAEAAGLCLELIRMAPATGLMLILATQRPDRDALPTGISANAGLRFCLRVMDQPSNDMVLGTGAHKNGIRANIFTGADKGIGWLVGASDDPQIVRTYYIDAPGADRICDRARALRLAHGGLTGYAAGRPTSRQPRQMYSLLDDLDAAMGADERAWSEVLIERLTDLRPDVYGGWTQDTLAKALTPYGIRTNQLHGQVEGRKRGANRRGVTRDQLHKALSEAKHHELPPAGRPDGAYEPPPEAPDGS